LGSRREKGKKKVRSPKQIKREKEFQGKTQAEHVSPMKEKKKRGPLLRKRVKRSGGGERKEVRLELLRLCVLKEKKEKKKKEKIKVKKRKKVPKKKGPPSPTPPGEANRPSLLSFRKRKVVQRKRRFSVPALLPGKKREGKKERGGVFISFPFQGRKEKQAFGEKKEIPFWLIPANSEGKKKKRGKRRGQQTHNC